MSPLLHWLTSPEWALVVKALLHSLWQGALIAVGLALALRWVVNPATRYRLALASLGVLFTISLITWGVLNAPQTTSPAVPRVVEPVGTAPVAVGPAQKIVVIANRTQPKPATQWTAWLALAWLLGASAMLGRASVKVAGAEQLRRSCQPLNDSHIAGLVAEARRAVNLTRQVRVAVTQQLTSPAVVGVLVPTLILPLSLITTLTPEQLRFILLHELAHIRRGDYLANLFQLFAEALFFFNPAVWWLSHQIRREREACCDALAIELSGAPADYARTLVSVAETMLQPAPTIAPAFGNDREPSSLADRVHRVLVPGYRPSVRLTWWAMFAALVAGGVLLGLLAAGTRETVAATTALFTSNGASTNPPSATVTSISPPMVSTALSLKPGPVSTRGYKMEGLTLTVHEDGHYYYRGSNIDLAGLRARLIEWSNVVVVQNSLFVVVAHTNAPAQSMSNVTALITEFGAKVMIEPMRLPNPQKAIQEMNRKVEEAPSANAISTNSATGLRAGQTNRVGALERRTPLPPPLLSADATTLVTSIPRPVRGAASINSTTDLPGSGTNLFTRTFKVDPNVFWSNLLNTGRAKGTNVDSAVRDFFLSLNVDLQPPKSVYFNDRNGMILVRASLADLEVIEQAIQVLNTLPPLVSIRAKFVEIPQDDMRAIGFEWFSGTNLIARRVPSSAGAGLAIPPQADSKHSLTTNQFTGILTPAQYKVVLRALEQREGLEELSFPSVTTVSGRQAQLQVVDTKTTVTNMVQILTNGVSTNVPLTSPMPLVPVLDVIPQVAADGYTIQMTVILTPLTEFLGTDGPGEFIPDQSIKSNATKTIPIMPPPRFRSRQAAAQVTVWDGQTIVMAGLSSEIVTRHPDGSETRKPDPEPQRKQLLIFITPTIIDPAGNRVHPEESGPSSPATEPK